jgi:nucleoside-diphosphate-sugar epimerase
MRALITGGKGFVGQWLAAHLKDGGDEVAVIDIETDVADGGAVRRVMADVAPDAIYHLAAMTHVGESWDDPSRVLRVNVLGTAEVLAAARSLPGSPRVLVVSSAEV